MKKKSSNASHQPSRPFGPIGTIVIDGFVFFFMLLPGGLITFHAIQDMRDQLSQSAPLPALTGTAIAILLGCLLFVTGVLILWKICTPASTSTETL